MDAFLSFFPVKSYSITLADVDLGSIAGKAGQRGPYISLAAYW